MSRTSQPLEYRSNDAPFPGGAGAPPLLLATLAGAGVLGTIALLAGVNTIHVIATFLADGLVPLIDFAAATLAGLAIVRRFAPRAPAALLIASGAGAGLGILITAGLLLGLMGLLGPFNAWLIVGVLALAGAIDIYPQATSWLRRRRSGPPSAPAGETGARSFDAAAASGWAHWLLLLAAIPLGVAIAGAALPPGILWGDEPHGYDVLSYHLQVPREWYEAGRIVPLEHNVFSHFPLGQETLSLVLMQQMGGPWEAMYAAQITSLLLMALASLAVFGAVAQFAVGSGGRSSTEASGDSRNGSAVQPAFRSRDHTWSRSDSGVEPTGPRASVLAATERDPQEPTGPAVPATSAAPRDGVAPTVAAVIFATIPFTAMLGSIAYNEPLLLLATALAGAWLLRAMESDWRAGLLAGLFAGLGVAAKYPAVPMLCMAGGLALSLVLPWRRSAGPSAATLAAFAAGALVFSLPWLIRNFAWTGNPVFPLATGLLGDGGWAPELIQRWERAHALAADETRLGRLAQDLLLNPRYAFAFWPISLAAGVLLVVRRDRRAILLGVWMALMLATWLTATHLQGRFMTPALPLGAMIIGLALTARLRSAGLVLVALVALASFAYSLPAAHQRMAAGRARELSLFGFRDLDQLTALEDAARARGTDVYLVGDARAFLYPAGRLHYKVVFNVPPGQGALRAWLGEALEEAPADALVIIDPAEIERLNRTYNTPPLEVPVGGSGLFTLRQVRRMLAARDRAN